MAPINTSPTRKRGEGPLSCQSTKRCRASSKPRPRWWCKPRYPRSRFGLVFAGTAEPNEFSPAELVAYVNQLQGGSPVTWTKLSCRTFKDNQTRLQLFALAYNLANFLRRLALPHEVKHWSLTTLREKLVKIGAKVTRHARYVTFQLA